MSNTPKRVFLIDSMSHIFRAFFAPMGMKQEPMRNSKGQVTQAVFVFTNMLRKLLNDEKPDYVAAVFDTPDATFRHDSFADYKANRAAMPDDLSSQMPYIVRVCEAFNIPILKRSGFEADDLIGTLALKCREKELQAVIVSNDKDLCQLVSDPYILCMRQNSQNIKRKVPVPPIEYCDEAWVLNKFGVPATKIIDLLGLMGDAVDNIPGAPGIGEKGALKIITEYGSIENAISNAEKITHKTYRESLQNNQDIIRQSLELATIHTEVDVELDLDLLKFREPNRSLCLQLFREMEFNTLTREFSDASLPLFSEMAESTQAKKTYELVKTRPELDKLIRKLWESEHWAFAIDDSNSDSKTSSFDKPKPLGIAISNVAGSSYYVEFTSDEMIAPIRDTFANDLFGKCVFDIKRNIASLKKIGVETAAINDDVLLAAYLLDPSRSEYDIAALAQQQIGINSNFEVPEGFTDNEWRTCERADFTFQLAPFFRNKLRESGLEKIYSDIEIPTATLLFEIEQNGMKVDVDVLRGLSATFGEELAKLSIRIFELAGREFKINSPKQVGEILQELNIETGKKTATGQISTSKEVLGELALTYELPRLILNFRELEKLKSTYTDSLPEKIASDGRIHGTLNQTVAATGRLSSTEPNLQNIPIRTELGQKIRSAFIPEEGNLLISADYSQLELRILAHVTQDPVLLAAFKNNEDIHSQTAKLVFGSDDKEKRRLAKIVNFGIAYAVEAYGLSQRIGLSVSESKKIINDYFETYKGVKTYMEKTPEFAREHGYVASIYGRRRNFPSINDRNFTVRSRAEREAINMPIQGSASDIVKIAMLHVDKALKASKLNAKLIMQIHDELLLEVAKDDVAKVSEILKSAMESAVKLDVPLIADVGIGVNWTSAK
jgi:DNA polymerase I